MYDYFNWLHGTEYHCHMNFIKNIIQVREDPLESQLVPSKVSNLSGFE